MRSRLPAAGVIKPSPLSGATRGEVYLPTLPHREPRTRHGAFVTEAVNYRGHIQRWHDTAAKQPPDRRFGPATRRRCQVGWDRATHTFRGVILELTGKAEDITHWYADWNSATASASAVTASGPSVPNTTAKSTVAMLTGSEMKVTVEEAPTTVRERLIA